MRRDRTQGPDLDLSGPTVDTSDAPRQNVSETARCTALTCNQGPPTGSRRSVDNLARGCRQPPQTTAKVADLGGHGLPERAVVRTGCSATMQLTNGKLLFANAVAFLALVGLLAETRYKLGGAPAVAHHHALDGEEAIGGSDDELLRSLVKKEVEAAVAGRVDAALAGMRGELEAARREGARSLANATATLGARVERLERDVDGLRSSRVGGAKKRRRAQTTRPPRCDRTTFQARTNAAMNACCPGGHHRRILQTDDCNLPAPARPPTARRASSLTSTTAAPCWRRQGRPNSWSCAASTLAARSSTRACS